MTNSEVIEDLELMISHWGEEENYTLAKEIVDNAIKALEENEQLKATNLGLANMNREICNRNEELKADIARLKENESLN